ncbi:hypothetical protein [Govanella unica]|uniref:Uncharacterized protein n=1 Tax=Govanella unica TaxID=2975056 RepID=A0A9X3TX49_9PROT|nr:hypothetical protein [Govania unica]MDA5193581.1 hypothetical protein [Govania unica]
MIRLFWLALSAAAAIVLAAPVRDAATPFLETLTGTSLPGDMLVQYVALAAFGALILLLSGFVIPAVVEGVQIGLAQHRINRYAEDNLHLSNDDFREIFAGSPFLNTVAARAAAQFVTPEEEPTGKVLALLPAERFFSPARLVESRLLLWLFTPLATLLWGLGLVAAALTFARAGGITPSWSDLVASAAWCLALPMATGVILRVTTRLIGGWRRLQAAGLCLSLDNLLGFVPGQPPLQTLVSATREQAQAIESSLREPLARLTAASTQLSEDQSAQVQQILRTTLKSFVDEVHGLIGQQVTDLHEILKDSSALAHKLDRSLTDSTRAMSKFAKSQTTDMTEALETYRSALTSFEEKSRREFGADFKIITEKLDHSASAFTNATAGADALTRNLEPLMQDMLATQKALLDAVASQQSKNPRMTEEDLNGRALPVSSNFQPFDHLKALQSLKAGLDQAAPPKPALAVDFQKLRALTGGNDLPEL